MTPATFEPGKLHYAISQFNAQTDSYYFRFDQNAIASNPYKKSRAANFPQSGKIRMLGLESQAYFFLINQRGIELNLPNYIRLGKFNSKARIVWEKLVLKSGQPVRFEDVALDFLLNAVDLSPDILASGTGQDMYLPSGMRFGVDVIQ